MDPTSHISTYQPSFAGDLAKVAFGKERNSSKLYCNASTQWFKNPLYFKDGNPIQIYLARNNGGQEYLNRALQHLGSTFAGQMTALG